MNARAATPEERAALAIVVGVHLSPDARGLVAVDAAGRVRGGALYDRWTQNSAEVHMAATTPLVGRALLPAAFEYPFLEGGRGVLLAFVRAGNTASVRVVRHLGFREVYRVADGAARGEDLILFELRREECRYLTSKEA